jgi:hypothetical protein
MGAALTYARRYALFTLVGIAGEDDIDAPDLLAPMPPESGAEKPAPDKHGRLNGGRGHSAQQIPGSRRAKAVSNPGKPILAAEVSAALRDQLVAEIEDIGSAEDAADWAHRNLGAKNSLTAADAGQVEEGFQARLVTLGSTAEVLAPQPSSSVERRPEEADGAAPADGIDKSRLAHPEPRRFRDKNHVQFVAKQPCLICGRRPTDAHHLRFAQHRALGRKVSDEFTVPLCRGHHRELHRCGNEAGWWRNAGVDPTISARALWLETHPLRADPNGRATALADLPVAGTTDQVKSDDDRPVRFRSTDRTTTSDQTTAPDEVA